MKTLLSFFLTMVTLVTIGQVYKPALDNQYLPAKVIFGDGVVYEVKMLYQQPEYFKNPQNRFSIDKGYGNGPYNQTGGIEAFMIDGTVWAQRNVGGVQQFVAFIRQGAIEEFYGIVNGKMGTLKDSERPGAYLMAGQTKRYVRNNLRNETLPSPLSIEKLREWIADSPEAVEDLKAAEAQAAETRTAEASTPAQPAKKGLLGALENAAAKGAAEPGSVDIGRIINNYNVYYEQRNSGKIKLFFAPDMYAIALPAKTKSRQELLAEDKAKRDAVFAGRSSTASPEMASAKDNIPVKKENFSGKLSRIKTDGNKVGVLLDLTPARSVKPEANANVSSTMINYVDLEGEYLDESLRAAGQQLVDELNATYNTTEFELIDISKIPYKEVKVMGQQVKMDDWWSTKYKVVFKYTIDPRLEGENKEVSGKTKFVSSINLLQMLIVTEYIGPSASNKQDILAQILNFGGFRSSYHSQEDQITGAQEMYEKVLSTMDGQLLDKLKTERAGEMSKLQKRLGL